MFLWPCKHHKLKTRLSCHFTTPVINCSYFPFKPGTVYGLRPIGEKNEEERTSRIIWMTSFVTSNTEPSVPYTTAIGQVMTSGPISMMQEWHLHIRRDVYLIFFWYWNVSVCMLLLYGNFSKPLERSMSENLHVLIM